MRIIVVGIFLGLSCSIFSQSRSFEYSYFRKKAKQKEYKQAIWFFQKWINNEHSLDSLQRVFIDLDLEKIRETIHWELIEDSLRTIYFRHYPLIEKKEISYCLWKLGAEDQKYRTLGGYYNKVLPTFGDSDYQSTVNVLSQEQEDRESQVYKLIKKYGWLTYNLVGEHAEKACFYITQHGNDKYRKKSLPLLKKAVEEKNANPYHYAMMYDRYLTHKGKKQFYGTQLRPIKGRLYRSDKVTKLGADNFMLFEIEDEINVNKRRAELGLKPLEDELKEKWGMKYVIPSKLTLRKSVQ
jgi:hypothetical protein